MRRKQNLYQRLSDLADFEAKPAEKQEEGVRQPVDILEPDEKRKRERFIPVTRFALLDRLTKQHLWAPGHAIEARRFFRYLDYWRQQQYFAMLLELDQCYEAFSPDSDLLMTRSFSDDERDALQHRIFEGVESLLVRANYERIDPNDIEIILTRESHYGLDLFVDMQAFERIAIYYRGASNQRYEKRRLRKFLSKEEFNVPIFQRLFLMFKLKTAEARVEEVMREKKLSREAAESWVERRRQHLPPGINDKHIYLKLFKNIPRTDLEMVFPNTEVRFRAMDKLRLGVTAGGGLGMGAVGAAGKLALLLSNPIAAIGALAGLGGIAVRQAMGFLNQKQRYMVVMAQNLYFHTMADNRGVILKIAARGAEEDVKEEMLLYSVLAKEQATRADLPSIDLAIENYLTQTFGVKIDFEIDDALDRLIRDGIVTEKPDGTFVTLPPAEAAKHIDAKWDLFLDHLPDPITSEGYEFEGRSVPNP
ncbi:MAG: TMEM143 family protein [Hyphomicrobium sp.]|uniref:TMEM143 family protein n=1 Tax=Hyphomicrobium sp. TaxID=82 RepID=UPI0039E3B011